MIDFFKKIVTVLNSCKIPYMLSGSVAMGLYVVPRFTKDFDFIIHLKPGEVNKFIEQFKEGYYCDQDAVVEAIRIESMFNIIDLKSNYKADFVILKNNPFRRTEFERRRTEKFFEMWIDIASAEDLLLSKMIWIQELQSPQQMEDIKILAGNVALDWNYIDYWLKELNLKTFDLIKND